jgi:hypothetical protein
MLKKHALQVVFAEDDNVIQTFASCSAKKTGSSLFGVDWAVVRDRVSAVENRRLQWMSMLCLPKRLGW